MNVRAARRAWFVLVRLRELSCCNCTADSGRSARQRREKEEDGRRRKEEWVGRYWKKGGRRMDKERGADTGGLPTLCLSIMSFAMHAGGPVSRNGVPM